jgi:acetoin:2,6-dichlorophenolindophenol oxidoreductase subunit beta
MKEITYAEAVVEALDEEMARDPNVFILGEDVGPLGGNFTTTKGLWNKYGEWRVKDTPISEAGIIGCALGAALTGLRPVAELMFSDFIPTAMDQIVNQVAKIRYMSGGQATVPLVIRTPIGGGRSSAAQHSQSLQALLAHIPGLKIVMAATAYEAKGLLKTAIRDDNPVVFFEHKMEYKNKYYIPDEEYLIPFGEAAVKREGKDVTIVATCSMANHALRVAEALIIEGIDMEVIDPLSIVPLDIATIVNSIKKTGRVVVVDEGHYTCGVAAEIAQRIMENAFDYLDAPVERVCTRQVPIPFSPTLENFVVPGESNIKEAVYKVMNYRF